MSYWSSQMLAPWNQYTDFAHRQAPYRVSPAPTAKTGEQIIKGTANVFQAIRPNPQQADPAAKMRPDSINGFSDLGSEPVQHSQINQMKESDIKISGINDNSLSIYEPNQLIQKLRSSLDQNKLSSSGTDQLIIEFNNKAIDPQAETNEVVMSLGKTRQRDSDLKQIQQSAIDLLSSSRSTSKQGQIPQLIQGRYKMRFKKKELKGLEWAE